MLVRSGLQAILVVLLARTLGPTEYGLVVAITSVSGLFAIFMGCGANPLHLRELSVERHDPAHSFAVAVRRNLLTFPPLLLIAFACVWWLYGTHLDKATAVWLVVAELIGMAASDLMQRTMQGRREYAGMAIYMCVVPALRVGALIVLLAAGRRLDIHEWAGIALLSAMPPAIAVAWRRRQRAGKGQTGEHRWLEGLGFAVAAGSMRVHADADKAVVARLASLNDAAQYSLAYRFFDVLMLPIQSFIEWRMPALFHAGERRRGVAVLRENIAFIAITGGGSLLMALVSIPTVTLLPLLLGPGYGDVVTMGHWLALLPITSALWWIFRTLLSTSGEQAACGAIELGGAAFNIAATLLLVGWLGWQGAVLGTYATHLCMSTAAALRMWRDRQEVRA
ncbi:hypothetical protein KCV01_g6346, partial [Aureobasidium melanogenum]